MRPIDADALNYTKAFAPCGNGKYEAVNIVYETDIDAMPTIDAVPVVRCKDCSFFGTKVVTDEGRGDCLNFGVMMKDDCFCSFGESRPE